MTTKQGVGSSNFYLCILSVFEIKGPSCTEISIEGRTIFRCVRRVGSHFFKPGHTDLKALH